MSDLIGGSSAAGAAMFVTQPMLASLRRSRPWILFLSMVGFGSCCLLLLVAIVSVALNSGSPLGVLGGILLGLLYMLMAVVYFFPALKLYQSAAALKKLERDGDVPTLESALAHLGMFWKIAGIITLVGLILYVIAMVIVIAALALGVLADH